MRFGDWMNTMAAKKTKPKSKPKTKPQAKATDTMLVPIDSIHPWARNPRKNEKAIGKVKASIERFGWVRPIIVNLHPKCKGEIIVGHTARLAAIELGMTEVPVRFVNMTPKEGRAANIADNKTSEFSSWDDEVLSDLLGKELDREMFEFAGFTSGEIDRLDMAQNGGDDGSALVEPTKNPTTKRGDLYLLGDHRLVCGDSTNAKDVEYLLAGNQPELMVTDPPYGVEYDASWRTTVKLNGVEKGGTVKTGKVLNDDRADWIDAWKLSPAHVCYVWHAAGTLSCVVAKSLEDSGFELKPQIIWAKKNYPMGRGHYHVAHEPCWYGTKKGKSAEFVGGRRQTSVWDIGIDKRFEGSNHSTQKPVECMARPIRNHKGDVHEPFCGSGTTIIACEQLNRKCYAMELSPEYCDTIVARWEAATGNTAERVRR